MPAVMDQLDREWASLATSAVARRHLCRWAATHLALAGLEDLNAVLHRRRDPERSQAVLSALAALAPTDEIAARTLLQALIPGIIRLAQAERHGPDVVDEMVGTAWLLIRSYPPHRAGSVAGNVLLDVRKRYRSDDRRHESLDEESREGDATRLAPSAEDEALANVGLEHLVGLLRQHEVDEATIELVVRTRVADEPLTQYAARSELRYRALLMRRLRAEYQLRAHALAG